MADYKKYTNSELEKELERLKTEYGIAQKVALENYQLMMELASYYGEAKDILETRTGKKKED